MPSPSRGASKSHGRVYLFLLFNVLTVQLIHPQIYSWQVYRAAYGAWQGTLSSLALCSARAPSFGIFLSNRTRIHHAVDRPRLMPRCRAGFHIPREPNLAGHPVRNFLLPAQSPMSTV